MKQLILAVLLIGITMTAQTQNSQNFFEELTEKYSEKDGFSASMLTSDMFDLYMKKRKVEKDSDVASALKNLDRILVVSQSGFAAGRVVYGETIDQEEYKKKLEASKKERDVIHKELVDHYKNGGYTLLKTEKRMGEDVKVYLKKGGEKINSLALITNSNAATNLVELEGDIDLSNVASLSTALNLRGLENLYKIDNSQGGFIAGSDMLRAYGYDEERLAAMADRARAMAEEQAVLSEEQMKRYQEQAEIQAQKQMEMAEKYREMKEVYGRQPIFLNYPGDSTQYYLNGKKVDAEEIKELRKDNIQTIDVQKDENNDDITIVRITTK